MTNAVRILSVCGAVAMWAGIPAAQADDFNLIQQKGQVSLGTFTNNSELKIRVDGEGEQGTVVDWGEPFGDKDVTRFRLDGLWRINPRHHVGFMYTDYSRNQSETVSETSYGKATRFPPVRRSGASQGFRDHRSSLRVWLHQYGKI